MTERALSWEGCVNVRDLGGHPTEDGHVTRFGTVVRADSIRQLTGGGWAALVDYGVRTIVDLRLQSEREADPPHPAAVEIVHIPLGDEEGSRERAEFDSFARQTNDLGLIYRELYAGMLERFRSGIARAVSNVGSPATGGVLVHCFAGKDRTGIVAALVLRLAGVGLDDIAADYGLSGENAAPLLVPWIAEAPDKVEREFRRRIGSSPAPAMREVLSELERRHGSVRSYLLEAGVTEVELELVRSRLLVG